MEKLEKKIESIVENNGHYAELIASEVKDIAIAFADAWENHKNDVSQGFASRRDMSDLFNDFINDYKI